MRAAARARLSSGLLAGCCFQPPPRSHPRVLRVASASARPTPRDWLFFSLVRDRTTVTRWKLVTDTLPDEAAVPRIPRSHCRSAVCARKLLIPIASGRWWFVVHARSTPAAKRRRAFHLLLSPLRLRLPLRCVPTLWGCHRGGRFATGC